MLDPHNDVDVDNDLHSGVSIPCFKGFKRQVGNVCLVLLLSSKVKMEISI